MKKVFLLLLAMMVALSLTPGFAETAEMDPVLPDKDIVVLFTSDVHCGIDQGFGYVGLDAVRNHLAAGNRYVSLVDDGDAIQGEPIGTLTKGAAIVELMNTMKYDVAIPGNHEFDYGMENFLELAKKANYPYVCANFTHEGKLVFPAYHIMTYGDVKVAFVGVCTPTTITTSTPKYFQNDQGEFVYGFEEGENGQKLYAAVQKAVDDARAEGANYVVVIAHLGIEAETSPYMSTEVIANTTGIDAVLDGHSHSVIPQEKVLNKDGKEVLLSAVGTKLEHFGMLTINTKGELSTSLMSWSNKMSAPEAFSLTTGEVAEAVGKELSALDETLNQVVATTAVDLIIADPATDVRVIRTAETNLGDLCADAYRLVSGADIAFVNGGGIRVKIDKGEITNGEILKVHPFGNELCVVEATGQEILDALEWGARVVPDESGGFLQVSGLTYEIHTYLPSTTTKDERGMFTGVAGEYRVKNVKVAGEDLDLTKTYTLASHNYMLQDAGDGFTMFQDNKYLQQGSMLDNQVLITYITQNLGGNVGTDYAEPFGQGRIVAVAEKPAE